VSISSAIDINAILLKADTSGKAIQALIAARQAQEKKLTLENICKKIGV
jgi:hypothetical protein